MVGVDEVHAGGGDADDKVARTGSRLRGMIDESEDLGSAGPLHADGSHGDSLVGEGGRRHAGEVLSRTVDGSSGAGYTEQWICCTTVEEL